MCLYLVFFLEPRTSEFIQFTILRSQSCCWIETLKMEWQKCKMANVLLYYFITKTLKGIWGVTLLSCLIFRREKLNVN